MGFVRVPARWTTAHDRFRARRRIIALMQAHTILARIGSGSSTRLGTLRPLSRPFANSSFHSVHLSEVQKWAIDSFSPPPRQAINLSHQVRRFG
ncbi:hypothetical protein BDQ12DRAFT_449575 [Crucibulum laeve]|uniref:Uncharacterized protein n=1 Tax=Crucibulum laeve TaxID=68775 RepID=A0A5C3LK40_9AGAR|nr:hypothetical protein BDQ12DRAFT_449575 [Crucibulum laeve]